METIYLLFLLISFLGIVYWTFSSKRDKDFDIAKEIPVSSKEKIERMEETQK